MAFKAFIGWGRKEVRERETKSGCEKKSWERARWEDSDEHSLNVHTLVNIDTQYTCICQKPFWHLLSQRTQTHTTNSLLHTKLYTLSYSTHTKHKRLEEQPKLFNMGGSDQPYDTNPNGGCFSICVACWHKSRSIQFIIDGDEGEEKLRDWKWLGHLLLQHYFLAHSHIMLPICIADSLV